MKTYIVQYRQAHGSRLITFGKFRARSAVGAIRQAAELLSAGGDEAVEIVATEQGE